MRTAKTLIRLGGCPGWSESSLGAQPFCWFCHVAAHVHLILVNGLGGLNLPGNSVSSITDGSFHVPLVPIYIIEPRHEKTCLREFSTRSDSNWPAQLQKLALGLKFWLQKLETLHYLGSEQQRRWSDCVDAQADLTFVVRIWHKTHFLMAGLNCFCLICCLSQSTHLDSVILFSGSQMVNQY